jgi:hypothetical protein
MVSWLSPKGFSNQRMEYISFLTFLEQILDRLPSLHTLMSGDEFGMNVLDT